MRALLIVVAALMTACAPTGAHPSPFPRPGGYPSEVSPSPAGTTGTTLPSTGYAVSGTALALRGVPYKNGGADPKGFDCSGFVWYVFAQHGLSVPRSVEDQFGAGGSVTPADLAAGDLVFFSTTSPGASHVGIVVGGDSFVHAPSSSGVVRVERLGSSYWASRFVGARRIL
jgi:cell wall-associated NlpC family hydrolase